MHEHTSAPQESPRAAQRRLISKFYIAHEPQRFATFDHKIGGDSSGPRRLHFCFARINKCRAKIAVELKNYRNPFGFMM